MVEKTCKTLAILATPKWKNWGDNFWVDHIWNNYHNFIFYLVYLIRGRNFMKNKRIAVVGSRNFTNYEQMKRILKPYLPFILITGGASGADSLAEQFAVEYDLEVLIHYPEWNKYGRKAAYVRNSFIIRDCEFLIAFWNGHSKGTKMVIELAKKKHKPCRVIRDERVD